MGGFVSICTGRTRGMEDIDVLFLAMEEEEFKHFSHHIQKKRFWCYQGDKAEAVYPYIKDLTNIRFAETDKLFPNIELVPVNETRKIQLFELKHPQKIRIKDFKFNIPPIEFEIAYKEEILTSQKDIADATH